MKSVEISAQRAAQGSAAAVPALTGKQKAAVIVRLLLSEGVNVPLTGLPDHLQAALTEQIGRMRLVNRETLRQVVEEFLSEIEGAGLAFPGGIEGAIVLLEGHISPTAATRLRRLAGASAKADPWDRIMALETSRLKTVLETESVEVGAVMLSKLPVARAAELLGQVPGDKARRIAYAVSLTGDVDPETVRRIGLSLAAQLEQQPPRAFDRGPVERVGAILNQSPAATRDQVLQGLDDTDAAFAGLVRKAIFTFAHIPERLEPRDVPKVLRAVDPATLNIALAVAERTQPDVSRFLLSNLSQRMADALREEVAAIGKVREKDAEAAMTAVITAIRDAEQAAEITLRQSEEEED